MTMEGKIQKEYGFGTSEPDIAARVHHRRIEFSEEFFKAAWNHYNVMCTHERIQAHRLGLQAVLAYCQGDGEFLKLNQLLKIFDISDQQLNPSIQPSQRESTSGTEAEQQLWRLSQLNQTFIGQKLAISTFTEEIQSRLYLTGLDPDSHYKPLVLLFCGLSGTGKTQLAREIAKVVFGERAVAQHEGPFVQFGVLANEEDNSLLCGTPSGYKGSPGVLYERLRRHKRLVVLIDEVDKCHSSVKNTLYQILDTNGTLDTKKRGVDPDQRGEAICQYPQLSTTECIFILTTNAGEDAIKEYHDKGHYESGQPPSPELLASLTAELKTKEIFKEDAFREGRIDVIVPFGPYPEGEAIAIIENWLRERQSYYIQSRIILLWNIETIQNFVRHYVSELRLTGIRKLLQVLWKRQFFAVLTAIKVRDYPDRFKCVFIFYACLCTQHLHSTGSSSIHTPRPPQHSSSTQHLYAIKVFPEENDLPLRFYSQNYSNTTPSISAIAVPVSSSTTSSLKKIGLIKNPFISSGLFILLSYAFWYFLRRGIYAISIDIFLLLMSVFVSCLLLLFILPSSLLHTSFY